MRLGRQPWVWLSLPSVVVMLGTPGLARAEGPPPAPVAAKVPDDATAAARAAHERGLEDRGKGDWAEAYSDFLLAWQHKRHWEIAVALGEAEMALGKYDDARRHLLFARQDPGFLGRSPDLVKAEDEQIAGWLSAAEKKLEARTGAAAPPPSPEAEPRRAWVWIGAVGGGLFTAGLVSGGVLTALSGAKVAEVDAALRELPGKPGDPASIRCAGTAAAICGANEERLRSADSMQSAATALFVTAGLVAATATILAVVWRDRPEGAPVVAPVIGAGSGGVTLSASW